MRPPPWRIARYRRAAHAPPSVATERERPMPKPSQPPQPRPLSRPTERDDLSLREQLDAERAVDEAVARGARAAGAHWMGEEWRAPAEEPTEQPQPQPQPQPQRRRSVAQCGRCRRQTEKTYHVKLPTEADLCERCWWQTARPSTTRTNPPPQRAAPRQNGTRPNAEPARRFGRRRPQVEA